MDYKRRCSRNSTLFLLYIQMRMGEVHSAGVAKEIITSQNLSDFFENSVEVEWQGERGMLKIVR